MASTEDELDNLAMRRLLLLERLLKKKQLLAEYMKSGFFQLGKARYALGGHAVSALRIPDGDTSALTKTVSNSLSIDDCPRPCVTRALITVPDEEGVSKDVLLKEGSTGTDDSDRGSIFEDNSDKVANKKPINWFSALPPQSLRQAQSSFMSSLQLAAVCVTMQQELDIIDQHYLETRKILVNGL